MNIVFIYNSLQSFVKIDLDLLKDNNHVVPINYKWNKNFNPELNHIIQKCDVVVGWWASLHMLIPTIIANRYKKPVLIIGGDYDIIFQKKNKSTKRIIYDKFRKYLGYYLFPRIDKFIVNSDFSFNQAIKLPYIDQEKVIRVYHGLKDITENFVEVEKEYILTVGNVNKYDIYRKGLKTFVESSKLLTDHNFKLVGKWRDNSINILKSINDKNIDYTDFIPDIDLHHVMNRSKVYVQVSSHEGFGMSLAEAMLFKNIPVVTNNGAIPEVVGDTGVYVPYNDPITTAEVIKDVFLNPGDRGIKARDRILSLFPIEKRRNELIRVINNIR